MCASCKKRREQRKAQQTQTANRSRNVTPVKSTTKAVVKPKVKQDTTIVEGKIYQGKTVGPKASIDVAKVNRRLREKGRKNIIASRRKYGNKVKITVRKDPK